MSAMLFALIFPRAQRASTYDISAERNVWLQSALRSFAIVCDYMETGLFAIVCDLNLRSGVPFVFVGSGKERLIQLLDYSSAAP